MKNYKNKNPAYKESGFWGVEEPEPKYNANVKKCYYCYEKLQPDEDKYHLACSKKFFGQNYVPEFEYDKASLSKLAQEFLKANMSVTGVQPKVSLSWHKKKEKNVVKKLTIVGLYGEYILKPQSDYYRSLPELEDCTMKMAEACGLKTVPHSLFPLTDGSLCYLTKRVDRTRSGMRHMEDMCQLTERLTEDKYKGSHEQVAKALLKYSDVPLLDVTNFYEYVLFSYFTGNADMHLKNFSLLESEKQGSYSLCPAYDLLNTSMVNKADKEELALTLNGKKSKLNYKDFLTAFENTGLTKKFLDKTLDNFWYCRLEMKQIVENSFLPEDLKDEYLALLKARFKNLDLN